MANLNLAAAVRDEGQWLRDGFSSRIANETDMDTFVTGLITRANAWLQKAVGTAWYASHVAVAPWDVLLKAAEMHVAQYELCLCAAGIAESGSDVSPAPFLGGHTAFLAVAKERMSQALEIVAFARSES